MIDETTLKWEDDQAKDEKDPEIDQVDDLASDISSSNQSAWSQDCTPVPQSDPEEPKEQKPQEETEIDWEK